MILFPIFFVLLPVQFARAADEAVVLPPIIVEGSASDALLYDPVVPSFDHKTRTDSSNGSITRQIMDELPVPVQDYGVPGVLTQVRGLGNSVEDTNVQTLGVPLNPAQGFGFDFSSFPQFLWSSYRFKFGPSEGAYDPRASTGTVTLLPWTADALDAGGDRYRLTQTVADPFTANFLSQTSVAAKYGEVAALVGISAGDTRGPSGSVSAKVFHGASVDTRIHLLATSLDEPDADYTFHSGYPDPFFRTKSSRVIPIVQNDWKAAPDVDLKSSLFFDRELVHFGQPATDDFDTTRSEQYGVENALLVGEWKLGVSTRERDYRVTGFESPLQNVTHLLAGRLIRIRSWTIDSSVEGDYVSSVGARPGASIGIRDDLTPEFGVFARGSYSENFPTLGELYYNGPGAVPNPNLSPEQAWTGILGAEWHALGWDSQLQLLAQRKYDALLPLTVAPYTQVFQNLGSVIVFSALYRIQVDLTPWLEASNFIRGSYSNVDQTNEPIPYDPELTEILRVAIHAERDPAAWGVEGGIRALTSTIASETPGQPRNGGYALVDLEGRYRIFSRRSSDGSAREIGLQARIDNLLNRPVEIAQGFPFTGIQYALSLVGTM